MQQYRALFTLRLTLPVQPCLTSQLCNAGRAAQRISSSRLCCPAQPRVCTKTDVSLLPTERNSAVYLQTSAWQALPQIDRQSRTGPMSHTDEPSPAEVMWMGFQSSSQPCSAVLPSLPLSSGTKPVKGSLISAGSLTLTGTHPWPLTQPAPIHCLPTLGDYWLTPLSVQEIRKKNVHLILQKCKRCT